MLLINGHIEKVSSIEQLSNRHNPINRIPADAKIENQLDNSEEITEAELDLSKSIQDKKSILVDELSSTGDIRWSIWLRLFTAPPLGWFGFVLLIILLVIGQALFDATSYWLAIWAHKSFDTQDQENWYAYVFIGLGLATIIIGFIRSIYCFHVMLCGSTFLHNRMLKCILYTSMRFFESNSSGRILSRASQDQQIIDELLPSVLFHAILAVLILMGSLVIVLMQNPFIIFLIIVILPIFYYLYRYYSKTYRQLKKIESLTRSPIYSLFSSSVNGLTSIRAFKVEDSFIQTYLERIDANTRAYLHLKGVIYWMCLRLEFITSAFIFAVAVLSVIFADERNGAFFALALACCLNITTRFQWAVRQFAEAETLTISAERVNEYTKLRAEEDNGGDQKLIEISSGWPNNGIIEFRNFTMRYRPELEPVLNNLTICIKATEKIGIIGRTGKNLFFFNFFI